MQPVFAMAAALACALSTAQADIASNTLTIIDTGAGNGLTVLQSDQGAHRTEITLSGSNNGIGSLQAAPLMAELVPGRFEQQGFGHAASLQIDGQGNGFAGLQSGSGHALTGHVLGSDNFAQVVQTGTGQTAAFQQIGSRNSLSIRQSSW